MDGFSNGEGENPFLFSLTGGGVGGYPCPLNPTSAAAVSAVSHPFACLPSVFTTKNDACCCTDWGGQARRRTACVLVLGAGLSSAHSFLSPVHTPKKLSSAHSFSLQCALLTFRVLGFLVVFRALGGFYGLRFFGFRVFRVLGFSGLGGF